MSILCSLAILLYLGVMGFIVLTGAFAWYESANARPCLIEGRFSPRNIRFALGFILRESLLLFSTVLLHPLGWLPLPEPNPRQCRQTPIILLHGLFQNRACWLWAVHCLNKRGFTQVYTLNLPPWKDMEVLTEILAKKIDLIRHASGKDRVHLVGHSMGGIIARNYIQLRGGASRVDRCVLLGSPCTGSKLAPFGLSGLAALVIPGSEFLTRLNQAPMEKAADFASIYSRHDNIVLPYTNGRLQGAHNIELSTTGHVGLFHSTRVFDEIATFLCTEHKA